MRGMIVVPYKTNAVIVGDSLFTTLDDFLPTLSDGDIVVITSKIVSICERAVVKNDGMTDKLSLIRQEADMYLDIPLHQTYGATITIKDHKFVANAGIDESNGNGYFILWPRDPFRSAKTIWEYVRKKYDLENLGIIITDSHIIPLQWGTRGRALAWCGLEPLKNYIGTPDIFGKNLHATKANIVDGLAGAAVTVMGEGNEQTPLAVVSQVPFVRFLDRPPSTQELKEMQISKEDDIYSPLTNSSKWKKGGTVK